MGIIRRMRRMDAVYWPKTGTDRFGKPVLGSPIAVRCRWVDKAQEFKDSSGRVVISNAIVYVDQVCTLGGKLWRGLLADAPTDTTAANLVYEIMKFDEIPNIKCTETLYKAWL